MTGGQFCFCFWCDQGTRRILVGSVAADYIGAGVVGCEGHHTKNDSVDIEGKCSLALGCPPWAPGCLLEAVAHQGRCLHNYSSHLEWPPRCQRGHCAHLGTDPSLRGPEFGHPICSRPRCCGTGGLVHTDRTPTIRHYYT